MFKLIYGLFLIEIVITLPITFKKNNQASKSSNSSESESNEFVSTIYTRDYESVTSVEGVETKWGKTNLKQRRTSSPIIDRSLWSSTHASHQTRDSNDELEERFTRAISRKPSLTKEDKWTVNPQWSRKDFTATPWIDMDWSTFSDSSSSNHMETATLWPIDKRDDADSRRSTWQPWSRTMLKDVTPKWISASPRHSNEDWRTMAKSVQPSDASQRHQSTVVPWDSVSHKWNEVSTPIGDDMWHESLVASTVPYNIDRPRGFYADAVLESDGMTQQKITDIMSKGFGTIRIDPTSIQVKETFRQSTKPAV